MKGPARFLLLGWLLIASCGGALRPWSLGTSVKDPYLLLPPDGVVLLRAGIASLEMGDCGTAERNFLRLIEGAPGDLPSSVWLQESRLAGRLQRAQRFDGFQGGARNPQADLRETYRRAAEEQPTALAYFLAARIEDDFLSANLLLEKALDLDPKMVWGHYGIAHGAAREGDWTLARKHLDRAFELQPGHLPSIRLFGWLQAQVGDTETAVAALEGWLQRASEDQLADQATISRVQFNLALSYTNREEWGLALELLEQLEGSTIDESDRLASQAVAQQGRGKIAEALSSALAGRRADRNALLPSVQNALLQELWLKDNPAALKAWREVIQLASKNNDLVSALQQFRGKVHLQRLERKSQAQVQATP